MIRGQTDASRHPGTVYLLHFEPRYKHAGHYIGWTLDRLDDRVAEHGTARGGRLPHVAHQNGCVITLARTWVGDRALERVLKNRGGAAPICPVCSGKAAYRRAGGTIQ